MECAFHTILCVRQVYPANVFVRRRMYDTPVFESRHPVLSNYIRDVVRAIARELDEVCAFFYKAVGGVVWAHKDSPPFVRSFCPLGMRMRQIRVTHWKSLCSALLYFFP